MTPTMPQLPPTSENHWSTSLWLVIGCVVLVLIVQASSSLGVVRATKELRTVLSEAHAAANSLEQRIGYGGLIHNFKNYVLRPEEESYREAALLNAVQALALLDSLSKSAEDIGLVAGLSNTREMLNGYASRLEQVRQLAESGLSSRSIDKAVRFDDEPALQEVELMMTALSRTIDIRLEALQHQGTVTSLTSTAGTAALGLLLVFSINRRQKKHAQALGAFADHLSTSNANLSKANKSLSQFAGIVSHDLKTPIRYIDMFNHLIGEDKQDNAAIDHHVDRIDTQVRKVESIIDSLLDFTKIGFSQPETVALDTGSFLADINQKLMPEFSRCQAHVIFENKLKSTLQADPGLLTRVISNLIDNSLKYRTSELQPHITVSVCQEANLALFSVADNGIGIDPRFAENIFEPMARLHGENSPYEGVGIGLSLSRSIVESHGGRIWLDTNITQGTRISFSIPLNQQRDAA